MWKVVAHCSTIAGRTCQRRRTAPRSRYASSSLRAEQQTLTYADLGVPQAEIDAVFRGDGIVDKITPDSDASIFFTSGTTGYPKAALASQRANMHNFTSGYLREWQG